jgi:hypothetical protein
MHKFWAAAVAAVLVCGGAHAAEGASPTAGNAAVGVGIICNTAEQAEQFVSLPSNGAGSDQAMHAVNANAQDDR